jgi:uncharacterized membrane protein HdeD (DUF308 family)
VGVERQRLAHLILDRGTLNSAVCISHDVKADPARTLIAILSIGIGLALIAVLLHDPEAAKYLLGIMAIIGGAAMVLGAWSARRKERLD